MEGIENHKKKKIHRIKMLELIDSKSAYRTVLWHFHCAMKNKD